MTCPYCHEAVKFVEYRSKTVTSLLGPIRVERAYYHCHHFHNGIVPWDEILGLGSHQVTLGAEEVISMAGCVESFGQAKNRLLSRMTGLTSSESTMQRTSEDAGRRIGEQLAAGKTLGIHQSWDFFQDVPGQSVGYISADATSVPQQGANGEPADERMPYVGMLYNPPPSDWLGKAPEWQARNVCGLSTLNDLGLVLRKQAAQVGFDKVNLWIGLTDGGNGLKEFLRKSFPKPKLQLILDFYHAAEHVNDFVKVYCGADETRATQLGQEWCHQLKHEGGQSFLDFLNTLQLPSRNKKLKEEYLNLVNYIGNNVHRMDYPTYQAKGWHIGSGPIESAYKTVVNRRLCGGGKRRREPGTDAICQLRALYRRYYFTRHRNHLFTPEFAVTRPLWFDQCLKAILTFPKTPDSKLILNTDEHVPELQVTPDSSQAVADVHIYYTVDPAPRARLWRSAEARKTGDNLWAAKLPILAVDQPLFAFANVAYGLKKQESEPYARQTERYALSSMLHTAAPKEMAISGVINTDQPASLIDDFSHGWQDWYLLEAGNPHHWEFSTRKLADPKWQRKAGQRLTLDVGAKKPNEPIILLTENVFRPYRGSPQKFVAILKLNSGPDTQTISLQPKEFKTSDGEARSSWKHVMSSHRVLTTRREGNGLAQRLGWAVSQGFGNCGGKK